MIESCGSRAYSANPRSMFQPQIPTGCHQMENETPDLVRMSRRLDDVDPEIAEVLREELGRQSTGIELIPSENFVSEAVLQAAGSVLTNKYAEGYGTKRYYGGGEILDQGAQTSVEPPK